MRTIARRALMRATLKAKEKTEKRIAAQKKMQQSSFRKEIKSSLGFENILEKLKRRKLYNEGIQ